MSAEQADRIRQLENALGERNASISRLLTENAALRAEARTYYGHDKRKLVRDLRQRVMDLQVIAGRGDLAPIDTTEGEQ